MQRSLRRIKHRIKRLVTSYVSPLGWAVTGLAIGLTHSVHNPQLA